MGETAISWATDTWNPTTGCDKVSPGCAHCYALDQAGRMKRMGQPAYQLDGDPRTSGPGFLFQMHPDRLDMPLRQARSRTYFVNSMSDLFHENVTDAFLDEVFAVMALCNGTRSNKRDHTFQVLTKRPERMHAYLTDPLTPWRVAAAIAMRTVGFRPHIGELQDPNPWEGKMGLPHTNQWGARGVDTWSEPWPLRNVWIGTSVENQTWAERRIPLLLDTPGAVRFLSCEPLLGPVSLGQYMCDCGGPFPQTMAVHEPHCVAGRLGWVIVGGESGPEHRPMDPDWVRAIRDACTSNGVAFHFKQWGGRRAGGEALLDGREWREVPR